MKIDSQFPGGNIVVESVSGDEVRVHQDLRDTSTDWFYWCFRVRGAEGRRLRFVFTGGRALGVRGPAVSLDQGTTWRWLGAECVEGNAFSYALPPAVSEVRLSFAMPFQVAHWQDFLSQLGDAAGIERQTLCRTAKGRVVECALLGSRSPEPRHRVVVTCRHHCCEMMAGYALTGLVRWLVSADEPAARWLREEVAFMVVPFVDLDGVEAGDQGKNRHPRDHGRDYEGESWYASTAAIRERVPAWGGERLTLGIDLHCPWIAGPHNEVVYLVGSQERRNAFEQQRFSEVLETVRQGPLPFSAADYLPFGQAWNTADNYVGGKGFSPWLSDFPGVRLATSIEIPYANAGGVEVNQATAAEFGEDLGRALAGYLTS